MLTRNSVVGGSVDDNHVWIECQNPKREAGQEFPGGVSLKTSINDFHMGIIVLIAKQSLQLRWVRL